MPDVDKHTYLSLRRFLALAKRVLGLVYLALKILRLLWEFWK
jgi:hypothetical protein